MADFTITYRGTVYPAQCDHMGHMNVMWYLGKFDEASWQLLARLGLSPSRMRTEAIGMVAVEQHIQYKRELRAGDVLTVRSSVLEVREKSVRLRHEMTNEDNGELAAITEVVGVCIDLTTRRSRPIPSNIHERITSTIAMEGCHAIGEASGQKAGALSGTIPTKHKRVPQTAETSDESDSQGFAQAAGGGMQLTRC